MSHTKNPEIRQRLRRAQGHLSTVVKMVEENADGLIIAQQMQAVVRALEKTKQLLILDHIAYHMDDIAGRSPEAQARLSEFREITKYL